MPLDGPCLARLFLSLDWVIEVGLKRVHLQCRTMVDSVNGERCVRVQCLGWI